jgi:sulfopyruvate decarboxylase subunit alpha
MSLIDLFRERMAVHGVHHLVSVANGEAAPLYHALRADERCTVIDASREGEAVAIGSGLVLGGRKCLLSMENFGLFECLDTLRALPLDMGFALPLLIGFTGRPKPDRPALLAEVLIAGDWTEPVLDLAGIGHQVLPADGTPEPDCRAAVDALLTAATTTAILIEAMT